LIGRKVGNREAIVSKQGEIAVNHTDFTFAGKFLPP
jgi:hypothetical protein